MKTLKTKFSALILILALTIGSQIKAEEISFSPDKKKTVLVKSHDSLMKVIAYVFDLNDKDLLAIHSQMEALSTVTLAYGDQELEIVFDKSNLDLLNLNEEYQSSQLEDWMFEDLTVEEDATVLEDWMFEELIETEEEIGLEEWMFDTDYFNESVAIQDWMLDTAYYNN